MQVKTVIRALRAASLIGTLLCALLPTSSAVAQRAPRQADMVVDNAQRQYIIDSLIREMNEKYVFPDQARKVEQALRLHQKRGDYDSIASAEMLAATLTGQMQQAAKDKHLLVTYSEQPVPAQRKDRKPSAEEQAAELAFMKANNFGVERIERLPFNIGYFELRAFANARDAGTTLAATMTVLANVDALIIDLRKNGGGDPNTVALMASYLLDERTHLNDIYWREGNRTEQIWSSDYVAGTKFGQKKDVYVLTSKDTFSAAEDLSYTLKNLNRATIVGETTGGGAHPGDFIRLAAHFSAFIPNGRSISPITKSNWEGTGVAPDLSVPADDALKTAQTAALKKLMSAENNPGRIDRLKARIAAVERENVASSATR